MSTLFFLDQPKRSMSNAMMFSKTAMTVVSAANERNTKNSAPQICPPFICEKMFGIVRKISDGPASGSTPKAKHAGMMMKPAISATSVSSAVTVTASPVRDRSFPR